jgi:hypothetical protein
MIPTNKNIWCIFMFYWHVIRKITYHVLLSYKDIINLLRKHAHHNVFFLFYFNKILNLVLFLHRDSMQYNLLKSKLLHFKWWNWCKKKESDTDFNEHHHRLDDILKQKDWYSIKLHFFSYNIIPTKYIINKNDKDEVFPRDMILLLVRLTPMSIDMWVE